MQYAQKSMINLSSVLRLFLLLLLCISFLSACGFKLRGAYQLPAAMQTTYISSQVSADFLRSLKLALKASKIKLLDEPADDIAVLKLFRESKTKRTVSVDSKGRAREYTLTYAISFTLNNQDQAFAIEEQTLSIERDFLFDPEDVLGNSRGEAQLYDEMQQDLVRLILLRLQSKA